MRKKPLFVVALALLMCFSLTFSASAQALSPREIILEQIKDLSGGYSSNFYNKASGSGSLQITRFTGSLLKELADLDLKGCVFKFNSKLDTPNKKASLDFAVEFKGKVYPARIFLDNDKIIFDKNILTLVRELVPQVPVPNIDQFPEYFYLQDQEIASIWKSLMDYRDQQMPAEVRDFLRFLLEAVPDKYFTISWAKITLELDQAGWEEVIYNLVEKVKNEKERFAGLIAGLAAMSDPSKAMGDPEELKAKIISEIEQGISSGSFPTREDIHKLVEAFQLKEFRYEASLIPGGTKQFKAVWAFQGGSDFAGQMEIYSNTAGDKNNVKGSSGIKLDVTGPDKIRISGAVDSNFVVQGEKANSKLVMAASARNENTGEVLLDLELTGESVDQVDPGVKIEVPVLTSGNSLDISAFLVSQGQSRPAWEGGNVATIFIDGELFVPEGIPYIKDGRTMVPVRDVAQALNCQVQWLEPNEVRITTGDRIISMYIGQTNYTVNGTPKQMDVAPVIIEGKTFIPVRFLAAELGLKLELGNDPHEIYLYTK